ncbi:hypothetical protein M758_3G037400 [Ceratodon purpureus]|nr:hypothetical protein M758_3G037400 [Ceratodon purpureus]
MPATIEAPAGIPTTLKSPPPSRKVQRSSDPLVRRFKMQVQELPPQPFKKPKQGRRSYPTVPLLKQITCFYRPASPPHRPRFPTSTPQAST